ncbi:MAG: (d)CMP kinase, partial [Desulfobacterales bacterium]
EAELRLFLNGEDITDHIRTAEITMLASTISARPVVREYLLDLQRTLGKEKAAVFEGRDMGTVVFPDADLKFFLDATTRTRALRRYDEVKSQSTQTLEEVDLDIQRRDRNDSTRELAPLKPAQDAIVIDSTDLSVAEVVELMVSHIVE